MTLNPDDLLQLLMGGLLAMLAYLAKQTLHRLEKLEEAQSRNTNRLIRIETKLGITETNNGYTGDVE